MIGDTTKICIRQDKEFGIQQKPRVAKFREDGAKEGGGGGGLASYLSLTLFTSVHRYNHSPNFSIFGAFVFHV